MVADDGKAFSPHLPRGSNVAASNSGFIFIAFLKTRQKLPLARILPPFREGIAAWQSKRGITCRRHYQPIQKVFAEFLRSARAL